MDVLVLLVVVQILPVGENLPAALEVTEEDFTFRCFPDSFGADLGHVLIARPRWLLTAFRQLRAETDPLLLITKSL